MLKKDVFVECNALELKAGYVGQTSSTVRSTVQSALGGCLFLDEAYALVAERGERSDSFSSEAIRTLLTEIENNRTSLLVVLAGYQDKMAHFMQADPGLPRRFPQTLHLDDYTPPQLSQICRKVAEERFNMRFEPGLEQKLTGEFEGKYYVDIPRQNAGLAVNLVNIMFLLLLLLLFLLLLLACFHCCISACALICMLFSYNEIDVGCRVSQVEKAVTNMVSRFMKTHKDQPQRSLTFDDHSTMILADFGVGM